MVYDIDYTTPADHSALIKLFETLLKNARPDRPLVIILDGLDRISSTGNGRDCGTWLPIRLPAHVKLVVTCDPTAAPDVAGSVTKRLYGQPAFETHFQTIPGLTDSDARAILSSLLADAGRTLTPKQTDTVVATMLSSPLPSPLALRVAVDLARSWTDRSSGKAIELPHSANALFHRYLEGLERIHGRALVSRALSYLAIAKEGVTAAELEDLLSVGRRGKEKWAGQKEARGKRI